MSETKITIEELIAGHRLPTLPTVAARVLEMTDAEDIDLRRIADVVQMDQALAAKVLRTVNSSFYGLSRPCGTVRQAMVYLGLNAVKTLVLSFSLVDTVDGRGADANGFNFTEYWRRSIHTAVAARELARKIGGWDPEEAFLAGLMQDVGVIALYRQLEQSYISSIRSGGGRHETIATIERNEYGFDHAQLGAAIAMRWKLPCVQVEAIRYHHDASRAPLEYRSACRIVDAARQLAASFEQDAPSSVMRKFRQCTRDWFGFDAEHVRAIAVDVAGAVHSVSSLFSINTGVLPATERLLAAAEERLVAHQIDQDRRTDLLQTANADLEAQVRTDPLTGVYSRRALEQTLAVRLEAARTTNRTVSVLFIDANKFKDINDTHGHLAGDAVLKHIAALLKSNTREESVVGRYGGDEFVIVLPNCSSDDAQLVGNRIFDAVKTTPCVAGNDWPSLQASVSIGLATALPDDECDASELLARADASMYDAKSVAGRIDRAA